MKPPGPLMIVAMITTLMAAALGLHKAAVFLVETYGIIAGLIACGALLAASLIIDRRS